MSDADALGESVAYAGKRPQGVLPSILKFMGKTVAEMEPGERQVAREWATRLLRNGSFELDARKRREAEARANRLIGEIDAAGDREAYNEASDGVVAEIVMGKAPLRLDLGADAVSPEGFTPLGNKHGSEIFPLAYPDGVVDVVRASHVLEHFPHRQVFDVIKEWVRVLRPGGVLRIAVPDIRLIMQRALAGEAIEPSHDAPAEWFIMGGQSEEDDTHRSLFERDRLRQLFSAAGLVLLRPWESELDDCARYSISLNLEGTKPAMTEIKVSAAMSVPRLGFMDNFGCAIDALLPLNIRLRRQGGAFWGQALENCMEVILDADKPDAILTLDYDSVFTKLHVATMMQLMMAHPEADAIVALQASRHLSTALFTVRDLDDVPMARISTEQMQGDLMPVSSAHFGLTLIRADKLRALPKPWFHSSPSPKGDWHDGHIDEDIAFWEAWRKAGNSLYLANRVAIGHAELMVRWVGSDLQAFYRPTRDFNEHGVPPEAWK